MWYPDLGAIHHITLNPSKLATKPKFTGFEKLHIGNGSGLFIHHMGANAFYPSQGSNKLFLLKDTQHVPHITKNLSPNFLKKIVFILNFIFQQCLLKDKKKTKIFLQ